MRAKFLLFVLGSFVSINLFGQSTVLIHQDFEGAITGWNATTPAPTWGVNDYTAFNTANFTIPTPFIASETNVAAISNVGASGKSLLSPSFNALGYDSIQIWFDYYFELDIINNNNYFEFGVSGDGFATTIDWYDLSGPTAPWGRTYLTLYPADFTSTMQFYFYYEGTSVGGLALDNIDVIGYKSVPNKTCANATVLTPGATCVPTAAIIELNSNSGGASACYTGTPNSDTWFQFTATSSMNKISAGAVDLRDFDLVMEIYSGNCSGLTLIDCIDNDDVTTNTSTGVEEVMYSNLVIGQTYYVRLYNYYLSNYPAAVNICIESFPTCVLNQPAGATLELEACGQALNDGCNSSATPAYQDISCGETIFGSLWAQNGNRDTDWYRFTINSPKTVTWTVEAELPVNLFFIDISDCNNPSAIAHLASTSCQSSTLSHNFTSAGTYVAFVGPQDFTGFACSDASINYIATLSYSVPTPTITAATSTTICTGGSVVLSTTATGTYQWYENGNAISGATSSSYTATAAGSYTVVVTEGSCASSPSAAITVTVSNPVAPTVTAGGSTTFCAGSSVVLTASGTGSSFQWYEGTTAISGATSNTYTATTAGSYTVEEVISSCTSSRSSAITVTVTPADDASFAYASTTICAGSANVTPSSVTTPGGTFSSTNGLAFVNTSSGEIDVAGSSNGNYVVKYKTAGTCPDSTTVNITITSAPDASFTYSAAEYCSNDTDPSPVFTTGSAGTFTGGTGLVINSSTGVIDLATSTAGVYTVTNSIAAAGGCQAATATASVEILEAPTATVTGGGSICGGATATITVTLTGAGPWDITISDGTNNSTATGISTTPYSYSATTAGTYTVTTVTDGTCSNVGTGSAVVANGNGYTITNNQTICPGGSYVINGNTYTLAGTYNDVLVASDGCDSTVITNLAITNVNTGVTKNDHTLTSDQSGATYQWIDCSTNTDIVGATSQSYTATVNGSYKVRVTLANCTEETSCTDVKGIGVNEAFVANVNVFPNPTFDYININAGEYIIERVSIVNIEGRVLSSFNINETNTTVDLSNFSNGMYFLHIYSSDNMTIKKLIKK